MHGTVMAAAPLHSPELDNLLPELLLGLLGHIGGAFVAATNQTSGSHEAPVPTLSSAVDWVSAPDREQLERLVRLGHFYAQLEAFVENAANATAEATSIYRIALANGVSELLDVYRLGLLQIEQRLAQAPAPPLLALQHFLADFEVLLPEVAGVVAEVQRADLAGSHIMRLLDLKGHSGVPAVQSCARRLLWHCNQVMFKQLDSWMVHGMLLDPAQEFFIQRSSADRSGEPGGSAGIPDWRPLEWHDGFVVSSTSLPPEVSLPTAHAALFVGKAVRVLRQPTAASQEANEAHLQVLAFSATLQDLQRQELLRPVALEHAVEGMQRQVAAVLWDLVQRRCDLAGQLSAMQSYFLLGRGDLYQQFLQESAALLATPPRAVTADADAAQAFSQAAAQSAAEADPLFASVSLGWLDAEVAAMASPGEEDVAPAWHPSRCASLRVPAYDAWDGLFLRCDVEWPLQLLFPPKVLCKYGAMWQYMFRLKRVQLDLQAAWAALQALQRPRRRHAGVAATAPRSLRLQLGQMRQSMAHFAGNLALYVQLDVVGAAAAGLRRRVAAATDFSEADAAHRSFVDAMVVQSFLDVRQLVDMVEGLFALCRRLCALAKSLEDGSLDPGAAASKTVELAADFRLKHSLLFELMQSSKLQSHQRAPALRQLILRLNFNEFCEREARQHPAATAAS